MTDFYSHHSSNDLNHSTIFKIYFKLKYANMFKYHREMYHVPCWLNRVFDDYHCSPNHPMFLCMLSRSVVSDSSRPHRLQSHQDSLSTDFSRQEFWSGLPFPSPGDLPDPRVKSVCPESPVLADVFFTTAPPGKLNPTYWCNVFIFALFPIFPSFFSLTFSLLFCHPSFPLFFFFFWIHFLRAYKSNPGVYMEKQTSEKYICVC